MKRIVHITAAVLIVTLGGAQSAPLPVVGDEAGAASSSHFKPTLHSGTSASPQSSSSGSIAQLGKAIRAIIGQPKFATTRWGVLIESLTPKRVLFSQAADRLFVPASNMKLLTSAAALVRLGPDYRFKTSVYAATPPNQRGVIDGDLILYGRGDPNLSSRPTGDGPLTSLDDLAEHVYRAGVREIRGNLIGDESYFSDPPLGVGWEWDDLQWYYGAEISALSIDDNLVELTILPGDEPGQPAKVRLLPQSSTITIVNKAITVGSGVKQEIGIHRGLQDNVIEIWGRVPPHGQGFHGYVSVHRPALYAATLFNQALACRGITVTGKIASADAKDRQEHPLDLSQLAELASVESIPLAQAIRIVNKTSQNLHAELLLRALGASSAGEGTANKGIGVIRRLLRSARARRRGISLQDGSGLSRHNLLTPATIVDLLRYMVQQAQGEVFLNSLPVAGRDGTLERRMNGLPSGSVLRAKTGTLRYTSALSGYLRTRGGKDLVFSILVNDHTGKMGDVIGAMNRISALLTRFGG